MADNDTTQTFDFTDLAQETHFKYKDKEYIIGAVTFKVAKELFAQAKKLGKDEGDDMQSTVDFLSKAVLQAENNEPVTVEIIDTWPMAMIQKVTEMVTEMIRGPLEKSAPSSPPPPAE